MVKTYKELIKFKTFEERFNYLCFKSKVGETTFGFNRYINQFFYKSKEWRRVRNYVILRDESSDLGMLDRPIIHRVRVHHMNRLIIDDFFGEDFDKLLNPDYLVCTSLETHNALHYGSFRGMRNDFKERTEGDTTPWKIF